MASPATSPETAPAASPGVAPTGAAPAAAPTIDDWPAPSGLDLQAGLARVEGDLDLYRRLLRRFQVDQAGFESAFRAAWGGGERETATRLAHTLKGLAGNLGAHALQEAARRLEMATLEQSALPEDEALLQTLLPPVMAALKPLLMGIATLEAPATITPPPAVDQTALHSGLQALWGEVMQGSVKAAAAAKGLLPLLHQAGLIGEARDLSRAIEGYDFDTATEVLKTIAGRLGVALES